MKIHIINTLALNSGDAAILEGEVLLFQRLFGPATQIHVYGKQSEVAARYYPHLPFHAELYTQVVQPSKSAFLERVFARLQRTHEHPIVVRFYAAAWLYGRGYRSLAKLLLSGKQFKALEEYASADLIVSSGGTYLVEHYDLDSKIFDLMTAVLLRKPLVLYTQSLGPFTGTRHRKSLRTVFQHAVAVLLRDELSRTHVRQLNVSDGNVLVTADAAFALADPQRWRAPVRAGERLQVAVSVREWAHFRDVPATEGQARYADVIGGLITHLVRHHRAQIVFLSTCQGIPEYWADDSRLAVKLTAALPADVRQHLTVDSGFHSPGALLDLLGGFDLVISTRMHLAILALNAGIPPLTIAYEFKSLELFQELGHGHLSHDIESITPEALIRSVDDVLADLEGLRDSFRKATLDQQIRVHDAAVYVKRAYQRYIQSMSSNVAGRDLEITSSAPPGSTPMEGR